MSESDFVRASELTDETPTICNACGVEADPRAEFTLTGVDDEMIERLDVSFNFDFDDTEDATVNLCTSCFLDGPGRAIRRYDKLIGDLVKYDLDLDALRERQFHMIGYSLLGFVGAIGFAVHFGIWALGAGLCGAMVGAAVFRYLWLDSAVKAQEQ